MKIYARIPFASTGLDENAGAAGRKFMEIEPYIKMMKVTYGEEVFDGFYPWMKNHEDLFEQYK